MKLEMFQKQAAGCPAFAGHDTSFRTIRLKALIGSLVLLLAAQSERPLRAFLPRKRM